MFGGAAAPPLVVSLFLFPFEVYVPVMVSGVVNYPLKCLGETTTNRIKKFVHVDHIEVYDVKALLHPNLPS